MIVPVLSRIPLENLHHAYGIEGGMSTAHRLADILIQRYPDAHLMRLEYRTFGIDDAHQLRSMARYRTDSAKQFILITAPSLTREAQNALLKLLEEPVAGVHFCIIVPALTMLLSTLRSRLMQVRVDDTTTDATSINFDAASFIASVPSERIAYIEKLLKKAGEADESKSSITRTILDGLESYAANHAHSPTLIRTVLFVRKYAGLQGASHKMLLEYLALSI